ncbi:MAG TPA: cupin domain-containing protein [Dyella sp.]|nr:cupin domain-containing protein [Dyella sp.]
MKKSIIQVLSGVKHLAGRTPAMAFGDQASDWFAEIAPYREGGVYVSYYSGSSEWERHPHGDEVVMVLDGSTTAILLVDGKEERFFLAQNELVVVPKGVWHRFENSERVKVMTVTPQPTDHSLEKPET